jgi:uncharacterized protein YozE (UPF0346 family)
MRKSFYHFLMKYRQPTDRDELTAFANNVYDDLAFPKQSESYDEVSSYLELNGHYLKSMSLFDEAWDLYLLEEN